MGARDADDGVGAAPRLAIVDDSAEVRSLMRTVAERIGWMVREFGTGREFVAALSANPAPDLVVLDIVMPDVDGIETIGLIAGTTLRCPIVLISGRQPFYAYSARKLAEAHGLEIANVLQKPVRLEELRRALDLRQVPVGT